MVRAGNAAPVRVLAAGYMAQSLAWAQLRPSAHVAPQLPPQSTSVSPRLSAASSHWVATQRLLSTLQTNELQSSR